MNGVLIIRRDLNTGTLREHDVKTQEGPSREERPQRKPRLWTPWS